MEREMGGERESRTSTFPLRPEYARAPVRARAGVSAHGAGSLSSSTPNPAAAPRPWGACNYTPAPEQLSIPFQVQPKPMLSTPTGQACCPERRRSAWGLEGQEEAPTRGVRGWGGGKLGGEKAVPVAPPPGPASCFLARRQQPEWGGEAEAPPPRPEPRRRRWGRKAKRLTLPPDEGRIMPWQRRPATTAAATAGQARGAPEPAAAAAAAAPGAQLEAGSRRRGQRRRPPGEQPGARRWRCPSSLRWRTTSVKSATTTSTRTAARPSCWLACTPSARSA